MRKKLVSALISALVRKGNYVDLGIDTDVITLDGTFSIEDLEGLIRVKKELDRAHSLKSLGIEYLTTTKTK